MARPVVIAIAGAAGVAALAGGVAYFTRTAPPASYEVCLRTDLPFVGGAARGCYGREGLAALLGRSVLDDHGAVVAASLSHPTDMARGLNTVSTCTEYSALTGEGWYAMSTREERREAFFRRACGALDLLALARAPDRTHFPDGELGEAALRSLAAGPPFLFAENRRPDPASPVEIREMQPGHWRLAAEGQVATVQEIAHADFTGDGLAETLVYVTMHVEGATATTGMLGFLEKPSVDAPVRFVER